MKMISNILSKTANHIVVVAFIMMFLLVFTNVVLRFLFSTGLTFSDEIARYAFVWTTFLGAVIATQENAHVGITGIRPYLAKRFHPVLDLLINIIKTTLALILLFGSIDVLIANIGTRAPFTGAPIAIAQASIVTCAIGMILIFLYRAWLALRKVRS